MAVEAELSNLLPRRGHGASNPTSQKTGSCSGGPEGASQPELPRSPVQPGLLLRGDAQQQLVQQAQLALLTAGAHEGCSHWGGAERQSWRCNGERQSWRCNGERPPVVALQWRAPLAKGESRWEMIDHCCEGTLAEGQTLPAAAGSAMPTLEVLQQLGMGHGDVSVWRRHQAVSADLGAPAGAPAAAAARGGAWPPGGLGQRAARGAAGRQHGGERGRALGWAWTVGLRAGSGSGLAGPVVGS